jgi:hypothetical protein
MASCQSSSSIPRPLSRPRITSDHFRPPTSDVPSTTSAPALTVNRKRPRHEQSPAVSKSIVSEQVTFSPRAFSANFGQPQHPQAIKVQSRVPSNAVPHTDLQSLLTTDISTASTTDNTSVYLNSTLAPSHTPTPTWKIPLVGVAATVAGRVWNFVSNNTFFGFRAGGGTAYDMSNGNLEPFEAESRQSLGSTLSGMSGKAVRQFSWGGPNVPGRFPQEEEVPALDELEDTPQEPTLRAAKRRQVSRHGDWVIVEPVPDIDSVESSLPTTKSPPQSHIPRLNSPRASSSRRRSHLATPAPSPRRNNSTAYNTISSNTSTHRTSIYTHTFIMKPLRSARSFSSLPVSTLAPSASEGSPRTPRGSRISAAHTLTSEDVAKFRAKKDREERLQDASMRKLNEQLRAMIKEGKAALGTRVEVDVESEEE